MNQLVQQAKPLWIAELNSDSDQERKLKPRYFGMMYLSKDGSRYETALLEFDQKNAFHFKTKEEAEKAVKILSEMQKDATIGERVVSGWNNEWKVKEYCPS